MDIHEYQAKALLEGYGVPIAAGGLAYSPEQATYRAKEIGGDKWVVKAQIHSGARGKAGGIRICNDENEVWEAADDLLGCRLVTAQTGPGGKGVYRLYIEPVVAFERELQIHRIAEGEREQIEGLLLFARHFALRRIAYDAGTDDQVLVLADVDELAIAHPVVRDPCAEIR